MTESRKVLYELDEHREANGRVYYFCSDTCREHYRTTDAAGNVELVAGEDGEPIEGTVCDGCDKQVA